MASIFAVLVLVYILWIVFNLMRSAHEGETKDIVIYRVDYPGVYVELAREHKADGKTVRKPAKRALSVKAAEGEGISDD